MDSIDRVSKKDLIKDFQQAKESQDGVSMSAIVGRHQQILAGDKTGPLIVGTPLYIFSDETSPEQIKKIVLSVKEFCKNILKKINMLSACLAHSNLFSYQEISNSCKTAFKYTVSTFLYPYHVHSFMKTSYGCEGSTKVAFILQDKSIKPYLAYVPDPEYSSIHGAPYNMPKYVISGDDREALRPWIVKYVIPQNIDRLIKKEEISYSAFDIEWYNAD